MTKILPQFEHRAQPVIAHGQGPVDPPQSAGGKLFAGLYALYCGLVVILVAGLMLAPVAHRILHRFHMEDRA